MREIKFEYGFESVNGIVKKIYHLHEVARIQELCDVWNVLPKKYVRQFTGLRDRNGKEIYEGDIITGWTSAKEVVEYDNDNARFEPVWLQLWNNEYRDVKMEVIGNIYENPELLNK